MIMTLAQLALVLSCTRAIADEEVGDHQLVDIGGHKMADIGGHQTACRYWWSPAWTSCWGEREEG